MFLFVLFFPRQQGCLTWDFLRTATRLSSLSWALYQAACPGKAALRSTQGHFLHNTEIMSKLFMFSDAGVDVRLALALVCFHLVGEEEEGAHFIQLCSSRQGADCGQLHLFSAVHVCACSGALALNALYADKCRCNSMAAHKGSNPRQH